MMPPLDNLLPYIKNRKIAAKKFGVSEKTIVRWLKYYDLYSPKPNYGPGKIGEYNAKIIRKKHAKGFSIKELAKEYEVTFSSISRIVNNLNYSESRKDSKINVIYRQ